MPLRGCDSVLGTLPNGSHTSCLHLITRGQILLIEVKTWLENSCKNNFLNNRFQSQHHVWPRFRGFVCDQQFKKRHPGCSTQTDSVCPPQAHARWRSGGRRQSAHPARGEKIPRGPYLIDSLASHAQNDRAFYFQKIKKSLCKKEVKLPICFFKFFY